jgi:hypothetical protein
MLSCNASFRSWALSAMGRWTARTIWSGWLGAGHGARWNNHGAIPRSCSGCPPHHGPGPAGLLVALARSYRACRRNRSGRRSSRLARLADASRHVWRRSLYTVSRPLDHLGPRLARDLWACRCEGAEGYEWGAIQGSPGVMGY